MLNLPLILFGKIISKFFRSLNLGDGSTWPGHIALGLNKNFIKESLQKSKTKTIIIAGTNGKTTTASLIQTALKQSGKKVFQNTSGANLLNGIASSIIINSDIMGELKYDFAIFEIDENTLPQILDQTVPDFIILLNLFRDQLDRYGEVNIVASRWSEAIDKLTNKTTLVLNADDPQIAYFKKNTKAKTLFFGVTQTTEIKQSSDQSSDSDHCPECSEKLQYSYRVFSHLGKWNCGNCGLTRPKLKQENFSSYPLPGVYNKYNAHAAVLVLKKIGLSINDIEESFKNFSPAFGRQETIQYRNKNVQLFLSKNPTSFNQSYQTILYLEPKVLLVILNDRIPDGRDISWIWDVDLPEIEKFEQIILSGERVYDMGLRMKYELGIKNYESKVKTYENLKDAIDHGVSLVNGNETFFILPTYSAMLESRKILTGKKIL